MTPDDMRAKAAQLYSEADRLRHDAEAQEARRRAKSDQKARNRVIRDAALMAFRGVPDGQIVTYLCRRLAMEPGTARAVLDEERRRSKRARKAERDRLILILAWKGWTNARLACRFRLHEKHVSRIITTRRGRALAQMEESHVNR